MAYFKLTDETKTAPNGETVYRIVATKDIPEFGVTKDGLGGWIAKRANLIAGWVSGEAIVCGSAVVMGGRVMNNALVYDKACVTGEAVVSDNAQVFGCAYVGGNAMVGGSAMIYGDAHVSERARILDEARVCNKAAVTGGARVKDRAFVGGHALITDDSVVRYDTVVSGDVSLFNVPTPRHAELLDETHCLTLVTRTSVNLDVALYRLQGGGHIVKAGCWRGTVQELRKLFMMDEWIETEGRDAKRLRPEMLALTSMLEERVKRWETEAVA